MFKKYLNTKRALAAPNLDGKSIPQLTFTYGLLYKYQIIASGPRLRCARWPRWRLKILNCIQMGGRLSKKQES